MQILLACAKTMNDLRTVKTPHLSMPHFQHEADGIAMEMSQMTVEELQELFHSSARIALQNMLRYQQFFDEQQRRPAVLLYNGQAYRGLQAQDFTSDDLAFAQRHLWITSFLYGLLRPMDGICPYRMEGNIRLDASENRSLFDFWKQRLTDMLIEAVREDDGILVHLATEEMQHLFEWSRVVRSVRVIQPQFMVEKQGRLRVVTVYAKTCRGSMTRYIIRERLQDPSSLPAFSHEGFTFNDRYGDPDHPHFVLE